MQRSKMFQSHKKAYILMQLNQILIRKYVFGQKRPKILAIIARKTGIISHNNTLTKMCIMMFNG